MHNAGFAALGLNAVYVRSKRAISTSFARSPTEMGIRGASVTIPFKQTTSCRCSTRSRRRPQRPAP